MLADGHRSKLDSAPLNACLNLVLSQLGASFPLFAASGQPSATNSVQLYLSAMHVLGELSHWLASPSRPQIIGTVLCSSSSKYSITRLQFTQ